MKLSTQVCIVGAGPSGLLLGHLLSEAGINTLIIEKRGREDILTRVRAGIIDQNTIDILKKAGLEKELTKEGVIHKGFNIVFEGKCHRMDVNELTHGRNVALYPQQEIIKNLLHFREQCDLPVIFNVGQVRLLDVLGSPKVTFTTDNKEITVSADFILGCDGFHGVCRQAIPEFERSELHKEYPFGWFGILCEAPRVSDELIYASHDDGFALVSSRSPSVQRMYLQCEKNATVDDWSDDMIWSELEKRTANDQGIELVRGPIIKKDIIAMRSFICEKMQYGKLFLVGDAAHIVPPSAAKGLNLAVSDACLLFEALSDHYKKDNNTGLAAYETEAVKRFWRAEEFSNFATGLFHRPSTESKFYKRQQNSALRYLIQSRAAAKSFAENYTGLPAEIL